jgi:hypothetical protein
MRRLCLIVSATLAFALAGSSLATASPPLAAGTFTCRLATAENYIPPPPTPPALQEAAAQISPLDRAQLVPETPPCASGEVAIPKPIFGPPPVVPVASTGTDVPPPADTGFFYAGDWWSPSTANGVSVAMNAFHPALSGNSLTHSLGQVAAANDGTVTYSMEEGWIAAPALFSGDTGPHLFIYVNKDHYRSNGQQGGDCYDCNFIPSAGSPYTPGMSLPVGGSPVQYAVWYYGGNWWVWYADRWIGYVPGSFWGGNFTTTLYPAIYGEVYDDNPPTTDMGDGFFGSNSSAAHMNNPFLFIDEYGSELTIALHNPPHNVPNPGWYSIGSISSNRRDWRYGGLGAG